MGLANISGVRSIWTYEGPTDKRELPKCIHFVQRRTDCEIAGYGENAIFIDVHLGFSRRISNKTSETYWLALMLQFPIYLPSVTSTPPPSNKLSYWATTIASRVIAISSASHG